LRIERIKLNALDLEPLRSFYSDILDLPIVENEEDSFTVLAGISRLSFQQVTSEEAPYYHFAFNVSENKIEQALDWLKEKQIPISPINGNLTVRSESWDSLSVYFMDPAGNIVEFIARYRLRNPSDKPGFTRDDILNISEIGVPAEDVNQMSLLLQNRLDSPVYLEGDEMFTPIGDEEGLAILSSLRRYWLGSEKSVRIFPMEVTVGTGKSGEFQIPKHPYVVRTS